MSSLTSLHRESLKEYITKRRLSKAAQEILIGKNKLIDIAFQYGYNSYEGFSRAFKKFYGCSPRFFKSRGKSIELLPRIYVVDIHNKKRKTYMVTVSNIEEYLLIAQEEYEVGAYILCFDIDHFESYNKRYGWKVGNQVIKAAASRIDRYIGEEMKSYHIGGDEFIVLTKAIEKGKVFEMVEQILAAGKESFSINGEAIQFNLSIGIASVKTESEEGEALLAYAQDALVKAKLTGRNKAYYVG